MKYLMLLKKKLNIKEKELITIKKEKKKIKKKIKEK